MLRPLVLGLALSLAACTSAGGRIDGRYVGPGGATLKVAGNRYEFCGQACTSGRMEIRPLDKRSGRVTFYGVPVGAYFRNSQQGPSAALRTWGEGVETGYRFGMMGGAYIDIDPDRSIYFKRRGPAS